MPKQARNIEWNLVDGPEPFRLQGEDWLEAGRVLRARVETSDREAFCNLYRLYLAEKNLEDAAVPLREAYDALQRLSELIGAVDLGSSEAMKVLKSNLAYVCVEVDLEPPAEVAKLGFDMDYVRPATAWITPSMLYGFIFHLKKAAADGLIQVHAMLSDVDGTREEPRRPFARGRALDEFIEQAVDWARARDLPYTASNSIERPFPKFLFLMLTRAPENLREARMASVGALSQRILTLSRQRRATKAR